MVSVVQIRPQDASNDALVERALAFAQPLYEGQLLSTGEYDGLSASGNASVRLLERGDVAPVNTDLIPNYADVQEGIKNQPYNSRDGEPYGAGYCPTAKDGKRAIGNLPLPPDVKKAVGDLPLPPK